jgi:hypothetical protein
MDVDASGTTRSRRPLHAHALAAGAIVGALSSGIAAMYVMVLAFYPACVGEASEATIVAPDSARGGLLCSVTSGGDLNDTAWPVFVVIALAVGMTLAAAVVWSRSARLAIIAATALAAAVAPWAPVAAIATLPADCTAAQWDTYGAAGCERDEELRPGFAHY